MAQVVTMEPKVINGKMRLVAGAKAAVDHIGMYRLTVPAGRYVLAVTPPPHPLDFTTIFPAYLGDNVDFEKAPSIEVRPGELRPSTDFLLLAVESHRIAGRVDGAAVVTLSSSSGYTEPLQTTMTDSRGEFHFDQVPAGSYRLEASSGDSRSGSVQVNLAAPEIGDVRIHLHAVTR